MQFYKYWKTSFSAPPRKRKPNEPRRGLNEGQMETVRSITYNYITTEAELPNSNALAWIV